MKRTILFLCLLSCSPLLAAGRSDFRVPRDRNDRVPRNIRDVGVKVMQLRYTSAAQEIGGAPSTGTYHGSTIAVYGVFTGSAPLSMGTTEMFVYLRSTDTANTSSELLCPPISFSSSTRNSLVIFNPPILAWDGLSANISSNTGHAVVFWRYISTNTADLDYLIPIDIEGEQSPDISFYGVKVASNTPPGGAANDNIGTESLDFTTDERVISTAPAFLWCVMSGTASVNSDFVVFEDSASVTGDAPDFLPPIFYNTAPGLYYPFDIQLSPNLFKQFCFPWPLDTVNGLTVRNSVATNRFRVLTRPQRTLR